MEVIAKNGNFSISSSFGTSITEGTEVAGTLGKLISFSISQDTAQYKSFYYQIQPITGSYSDFWNDFYSNKVGGEPADSFALSGFTSDSFQVKINPDSIIENNETFSVNFYLSNLDPYRGISPIASAQFTIIDDDTPIRFSSNGLIDYSFYRSQYPDVAASGISPEAHYNASGWHEGRNPNALFSTTGYLAANQDVAKAGINPLTHYDQFGWKEGRDASASFDNELYLAHNADVKAAGLDPFAHYLQSGQAEGRQAYAAIGNAADFTHGSFDAEYYLLANADVAKAALASGGDTFNFAYQHYHTSGWQEGRKADAFFDSAYYLAHNPDVAAAHIDPLAHYDQSGWQEGRDPSAAFHTNAYLAANPDVATAHIDPLTHYLQFGADEGRHLA